MTDGPAARQPASHLARGDDHDVKPRFKARTRCYVDAGDCVFEVKVKNVEGETDKRQTADTDAKRELLEATLRDAGIEAPGS